MSNFWNNSEPVSEYEMMADEMEEQAQQILDEYSDEEPEEEYEEEYEEHEEEESMSDYEPTKKTSAYRLNKKQNSVVNDAMIRLEQARLYDMLIKHDMFKGVKAHPTALNNVKKELKDYIVSRLEILLGIKGEKKEVEIPKNIELELPFNSIEVEFLKALSMKGTKGASVEAGHGMVLRANLKTQTSPAEVYEDDDEYEEEEYEGLQPLSYEEEEDEYEEEEYVAPAPKPKKKVKKPAPKPTPKPSNGRPVRKAPPKKKKPVKKAAPVQKHKPSRAIVNRKGEISDAEAERIAREDMERMKGRKPVNEMTPTELMEANKRINTKKNNIGQKPIPTGEQLNMYYQTQQMNNQLNQQNNPGAMIQNKLLQKILSEKK